MESRRELATLENLGLFLLHVVVGLLFMQHGGQKMLGWFGGIPGMGGPPPIGGKFWFAGVIELCGGALILLGLFTRPVAFITAGEMAVAFFTGHFMKSHGPAPASPWPIINMGEPAVLYCFIFLLLFAFGAGKYSLDYVFFGRKKSIMSSA